MCGRFELKIDDLALNGLFSELWQHYPTGIFSSGEVFPSTQIPALVAGMNGSMHTEIFRWGYDNPCGKGLMINARAETVADKPFFRYDFKNRRCLIPAHGFYEWSREKKKFHFQKPDGALFFLCGIFRQTTEKSTCLVLTKDAVPPVSYIHNRMPVLINIDGAAKWLGCEMSALLTLSRDSVSLINSMD